MGGSGMKESEEMHLKCAINESTLSTADAVHLPRVGKVASKASRIGFWRYEKERGDRLRSTIHKSTLCKTTYKTYL